MRTNLDYLQTMSEDSSELIIELIDIFNDQVIEFSVEMQNHLNNKDYDSLGKLAHKARSSVLIMGMSELSEKLGDLETRTLKLENIDTYQDLVDHFKTESLEAIKELNQYKSKNIQT